MNSITVDGKEVGNAVQIEFSRDDIEEIERMKDAAIDKKRRQRLYKAALEGNLEEVSKQIDEEFEAEQKERNTAEKKRLLNIQIDAEVLQIAAQHGTGQIKEIAQQLLNGEHIP